MDSLMGHGPSVSAADFGRIPKLVISLSVFELHRKKKGTHNA